jgi:hypothetical protein
MEKRISLYPAENRIPVVHPVAESLYRLSYPGSYNKIYRNNNGRVLSIHKRVGKTKRATWFRILFAPQLVSYVLISNDLAFLSYRFQMRQPLISHQHTSFI